MRNRQKVESHFAVEPGRLALQGWAESKPKNFFTEDQNLHHILSMYMDDDEQFNARLEALGRACAHTLDPAAAWNDQRANHPRLQRYDAIGQRTETVEFHPSYDVAGQVAYDSGIMALQTEPGQTVKQFGLFYLLGQCGEMGHTCPIACTAGLIKVLQHLATPELQEKYLSKLLDPHYQTRWHGAQFLTEVNGGSDVGANTCVASPREDGSWHINGEKWFCSNVTADLAVVTARPDGAPSGTKGLGLFLVPRRLDDGMLNGVYIRRLKDKIGTRTLATAEVEFQNALAYALGPLDQGFKNMVNIVLNTSRLFNAAICAGFLRRAWVEASGYAQARKAFGQPILRYPLVQEALALIKLNLYAVSASTFRLAHVLDRAETGKASVQERRFFRLAVNMNKYHTSIQNTEGVHTAIEVLGGHGAVEDFSILPRLYRDAIVLESWEGAHNVLCAQVFRDATQRQMIVDFWDYLDGLLDDLTHPAVAPQRERLQAALCAQKERFEHLVAKGETFAQIHMRRWVDGVMDVFQALCLALEAQWALQRGLPTDKPDALALFVDHFLNPGYDPMADEAYFKRLAALSCAAHRGG